MNDILLLFRYGNIWSDWHGEVVGDIASLQLNPGTLIKSVEGGSIDNASFYMLNFTMSDGTQQIFGMSSCCSWCDTFVSRYALGSTNSVA